MSISSNQDVLQDLSIAKGGTGGTSAGVSLVGGFLDESSQVIGDNLIIADAEQVIRISNRKCSKYCPGSLVIQGDTGVGNTDNGVDFRVPYNTVRTNDDTSIYDTSTIGVAKVLKSGRYLVHARYSTYDLVQSNLPTVDGTKFLRITATVNGVKTCVLNNLLVATALNGEAVATGGGTMDLNANDELEITGYRCNRRQW